MLIKALYRVYPQSNLSYGGYQLGGSCNRKCLWVVRNVKGEGECCCESHGGIEQWHEEKRIWRQLKGQRHIKK